MLFQIPSLKKKLYQLIGFPHIDTLTEMDLKLNRLESDIDRYKARLRNRRLKKSYEEILNNFKDGQEVEKLNTELEETTPEILPAKNQPSIIVLDLEEQTHQRFKDAFSNKYQVKTTDSIEQAIEFVKEEEPHYFFFERALMGKDEIRSRLSQLQSEFSEIKWIAMNNYLTHLLTQEGNDEFQIDESIQKPLNDESLARWKMAG